jgi:DNA-binding beta-propeller fold protein YncE
MKPLVVCGGLLAALFAACSEPGDRFDRPTAVAFDPRTGEVVVSDGYNHARVARFSRGGTFVSDFGKAGAGEGDLRTPHGIAVDGDGRIYVADRENARVQVFDRDGSVIAVWGSALVGRPWALTLGRDGFVYVVDGGDQDEVKRGGIVKLTRDGRVVARLSTAGGGEAGLDGAHAIAVGNDGAIYIAESDGKRVRKLIPQ